MGEHTDISWTDHTFNPWWGCTEVSPGCDRCYARELDKHWFPVDVVDSNGFPIFQPDLATTVKAAMHWGKGAPRRVFADKHWNEPPKWNRDALKTFGRPARVFCASMADIMDDEAPEGQRERLWELIDQTPNLIWQLLTKRPQRYGRFLPGRFKHDNVWLGVTAENQEFYDVRWPLLLRECANRNLLSWISYEPALGPLTLTDFPVWPRWIIFGGESGHGRRLCEVGWAEKLLAEIRTYQPWCSLFVKQMAGRTPAEGKAAIPEHLRIQEFPA